MKRSLPLEWLVVGIVLSAQTGARLEFISVKPNISERRAHQPVFVIDHIERPTVDER